MGDDAQKFLGRNRPPRVQIEYEVDVGGASQKVELPFVMGVMADLSGDANSELPHIDERGFQEFDAENLDERMNAIKPRVGMRVPNRLSGEGELGVDLTFESMEDFEPAAVARRVDSTRRLLEAREKLANLLAYTDGKQGAEDLLQKVAEAGPEGWKKILEFVGAQESDSLGGLLKSGSAAAGAGGESGGEDEGQRP